MFTSIVFKWTYPKQQQQQQQQKLRKNNKLQVQISNSN